MVIANLLPRAMDRARRMETGLAARGWQGEMRVIDDRPAAPGAVLALILVAQAAVAALGVLL